ncbi:MAG: Hsp20/alpha crystallin family protein [Bacillota bacterium]
MDLVRWNPFNEFERMRQEMGRLWGFGELPREGGWWPSVDVHETEREVVISADLPGIDPDQVEVNIDQHGLVLQGETRSHRNVDEQGYRLRERRYGTFRRVVPFPVEVESDKARAFYTNGVLEIRVPKAQPGQRVRRLPIDRGGSDLPQS